MDWQGVEAYVFEKMRKTHLPGLSIAAVKDGEVVYARGFGFRDVESGAAMTPQTRVGIGSVTKSFTALAIMMLVEEGKISLDDPVDKFVPMMLRPLGEPVRIWHLLTHSSGIPALAYAEAFIRHVIGEEATWLPIASVDDLKAFMSDAEGWAVAKPGERFFYLNEGYLLLGRIIEELEPTKRGPYAGSVGYFSFNGNMDMAITIRTIVLKGTTAYVQAGAGIVADSVPEREYQETVNKAKALLTAIDLAEQGLES